MNKRRSLLAFLLWLVLGTLIAIAEHQLLLHWR